MTPAFAAKRFRRGKPDTARLWRDRPDAPRLRRGEGVATRLRRSWLVAAIALAGASATPASAQSVTVRAAGDTLQVRGSGLRLIEGPVADHLKDGRSVRVEFEMTILDRPQGATVTQNRQAFVLSYDLWEQRYAVTRTGGTPRSISHLLARDAEAWCLENMAIPLTALGRFARDLPFWIRIDYRVQDRPPADADAESAFTLRTLIEVLSRRRPDETLGRTFESGPFRIGQ